MGSNPPPARKMSHTGELAFLRYNQSLRYCKQGVEIRSDLSELGYVEMNQSGAWRMKLAREMNDAGIPVDIKKVTELS